MSKKLYGLFFTHFFLYMKEDNIYENDDNKAVQIFY